MTLTPNLAQINSAAKGNNDLREALTSLYLATQQQQAQTGTGPLKKIDTTPTAFTGPPPQCGLSVTGANGQFNAAITLPQQAGGSQAPKNAANAPIYQEISSSRVASFRTGVTTYPVSTNTSYVFPNPGATLYWRLRSSYDQKTWNGYSVQAGGAVSAGLQSSAATERNLSLNQSNFATIDSIGAGPAATVRIYGSGGVGSSWTSIVGTQSTTIPGGTILNVAYGRNLFVAWDGEKYQSVPWLTQTFPDAWIPVGKVSVIANGSGLILPTFKAIVSSGAIVAIQIVTAGNGMTADPAITITDSTGTGASATCTESGGSATGVIVTNAGSGYSSDPTVTASGGVAAGSGGGGGATGNNGGRLYADV